MALNKEQQARRVALNAIIAQMKDAIEERVKVERQMDALGKRSITLSATIKQLESDLDKLVVHPDRPVELQVQ